MKSPASLLYSAAAFLISFGSLRAQNNPAVPSYGSSLVSSAHTADEAWTSVISLATSRLDQQKLAPALSPSTGSPPSSAQPVTTQPGLSPSAEPLSQIDQYIQASLAAQAYYRAYPTDARASQAKKMETLFALQSVELGADSYRPTASALGTAYRVDKSNAATDRFEVAQAMEVIALAPTLKGQRFLDVGVTYEQMADDLYGEFGELDQVYNVYTSIVRTTDPATSSRVAAKVLGRKQAPAWAKTEAQTALDRNGLLGKPVNLKLTTVDGQTIDLQRPGAQATVVYFWNGTSGGAELSLLNSIKWPSPPSARWIYIALGGAAEPSATVKAQAPFPGSHCFERAQFGGPTAAALKVAQTPFAYVLNAAGQLTGFGPAADLPALLQAAH